MTENPITARMIESCRISRVPSAKSNMTKSYYPLIELMTHDIPNPRRKLKS